jgi:signal transduction histidine kinase
MISAAGVALASLSLVVLDVRPVRGESPAAERAAASATVGDGRAILFISSEHASSPTVQLVSDGFREAVEQSPRPLALYQEFLDTSRFPGLVDGFRRWLREKYRGRRVDLVVASGQEVVAFLARDNPFPDAPILYSDVGALTIDIGESLPQASGVVFEDHFHPALAVIKGLLPDTRHIALVHGAFPGERARFARFASAVRSANLGLEPVDLGGLDMDDLLRRVASLPPGTVLFLFSTQADARGPVDQPRRACELIAAAANRPLFSLQMHELGCGVVGGLVRDFKVAGRILGEHALRRLEGRPLATVTVPAAEYTRLVFDEREVTRWGISEARLPAGSTLEFRSPSLWRDHGTLMISVLVVGIVQTLLIARLLYERRGRRRAERQSREHLVAMTHLDRRAAMGEMSTALAHELRQPLGAILHNAESAQMILESGTPLPDEMSAIVADILKADQRASEIIQRMRSLLQKHELERKPVDVNGVVQDTVSLVLPVAASRETRIHLQLEDGLAPIAGDRIHLQQVLLNVLLNALEAVSVMGRDRRWLVVRTEQRDHRVEVSVQDAGCGIPAEAIARVFEPFYTTKDQGMGMGLSIARSILEAHGGGISAENNPEGGATLRSWLPVGPG